MLNLDILEKGPGLVSLLHFVYNFSRKIHFFYICFYKQLVSNLTYQSYWVLGYRGACWLFSSLTK